MWAADGIVPILAVKFRRSVIDLLEFLIANRDTCRINVLVQFRLDREARICRSIGNQINDHFVVNQWPTPPILGDVAEHSMLNLVPFTRAWRKVAHINPQIRLIGKLLQFHLP